MTTKREIKTANNKQALLKALLIRIKNEEYEKIKIGDLCKDASVSEASFYNYFPRKSDLLVYFVQLWSVEAYWKVMIRRKLKGLAAIESVFRDTARTIKLNPEIMGEIITFHARWRTKIQLPTLTDADKNVAYPHYEGIEAVPSAGLDSILGPNLETAVDEGQLPRGTPLATTILTLKSIFFGVPMFLKQLPFDQISTIYHEQLETLWAGIRKSYQ